MAYILNIETATRNCSIAIAKEGKVLLCIEIAEEGYSHAEKLHVFIEETLAKLSLNYSDLNAVAVSQGPGSYTGLRIGVSAAKGLCYALNIPLIAIDTLESLARKITVEEGIIVPMIDARRMEVFAAHFDKSYNKLEPTSAIIIDEKSFVDKEFTMHLIGDGALKCQTHLTDAKYVYYPAIQFPSANEMGCLSYQKYLKNDFVDVAYFEPFYLKDFVMTTKAKV